jgi:hypothetical protein
MTDDKANPNRMAHVTMRIPQKILDYYKRFPNPRGEMREVLIAYVKERTGYD